MKRLVVLLMITTLSTNVFSASGKAAEQDIKKPTIEFVQTGSDLKKSLLLEYDNFKDLQTFNFNEIKGFFDVEEGECEVTATVTVTSSFSFGGNVGVANSGHATTVSITASVTASCDEIGNAVKNLIANLKNALGV